LRTRLTVPVETPDILATSVIVNFIDIRIYLFCNPVNAYVLFFLTNTICM